MEKMSTILKQTTQVLSPSLTLASIGVDSDDLSIEASAFGDDDIFLKRNERNFFRTVSNTHTNVNESIDKIFITSLSLFYFM